MHGVAGRCFGGSQVVGDLASVFASHVRRHILESQLPDTVAARLNESSAALGDLRVVDVPANIKS